MRKTTPPHKPGAAAAPEELPRKRPNRLPELILNWASLTGIVLVVGGFITSAFFLLMEFISSESASYMGLVYLVLLFCMVAGIVLVPAGMLLQRRKLARGGAPVRMGQWIIDFSRPGHRYVILVFVVGAVTIPLIMATGSYKVYQLTESNAFCGQVCHSVMQPEWVAYQYSSHARVKCVECHIGSGAGWYVRSKLSGFSQIIAVTTDTYPRPIPTPIHNLRPARETCEECHWPSKFIGYRELIRSYYLSDEANSPFKIRMLMKIGGERSKLAAGSGIHYHMLIATRVEYIARDPKRQDIAWVRIRRADGSVTEFKNVEEPLSPEEIQNLEMRTMDCMDCHNRPAHKFPVPMNAVNSALEQNLIPVTLPHIKLEATRALDKRYETADEATAGLANHLRNYYREKHPQVIEQRPQELAKAIAQVQRIYRLSNFPEMKASWAAYPDNIGHRDWPGCFRCHNENMKSEEGFTIFTTCNKCHLILAQGKNIEQVEAVNFTSGLPFFHPGDEEYVEEFSECVECHSGGAEVYD